MMLILNTFITDNRGRGNRYPRLDVFKYAINSYRNICFSEVFLYIKLDDNYLDAKDDLLALFYKIFANTSKENIHIEFDRLYKQPQWFDLITKIYNEKGGNYPVLFLNNDDHVFVDSDTKILYEGLEIFSKETTKYKSIYISHWPEIIKLSGKYETPEKIGNYISFNLSLLDSIQIFNLELLYYILVTYVWKWDHPRIDDILNELTPTPSQDNPLSQKIFAPLKELFRKFDGYGHVNMSVNHCPPLVLPYNKFMYDRDTLVNKITAPHYSLWTQGNFTIPNDWIETNLSLHDKDYYELSFQ